MKIIPVGERKFSLPVKNWRQIRKQAKELRAFATEGPFPGPNFKACYALHHSQVEEKSFNFFVLSEKAEKLLDFPHWCIINPEIIAGTFPYRPLEGCMSWPFRKASKVDRYAVVRVRFQYPRFNPLKLGIELKTIEKGLEKLAAQVFQHETDHGKGRTIHG